MTDRWIPGKCWRCGEDLHPVASLFCPAWPGSADRARPDLFNPLGGFVANMLYRNGFRTIEEVCAAPDEYLLSLRNFGKGSLRKIRAFQGPAW